MAARRILFTLLVLAFLGSAGAAPVRAQTAAGQLVEIGSGKPVRGAVVTLLDTLDAELASMASDTAGAFLVVAPGPGRYRLHIRRGDAYTMRTAVFALDSTQTRRFRLEVPLPPIPLEALDVTTRQRAFEVGSIMTGFNQRRAEGHGTFLTRDELAEVPESTPIVQILAEQTGVHLARTEEIDRYFELRSGCPPKLVVDGSVWIRAPILSTHAEVWREFLALRAGDIQAVEIYRGTARIPPLFAGSDAQCGVIAVWLRRS